MPRKLYTAAFKRQAVALLTEQQLSVAEVARRLDVSENCLREWHKAVKAQGDAAFPGQGQLSAADDELRRLRAEVQRLKAERDLLPLNASIAKPGFFDTVARKGGSLLTSFRLSTLLA